MTEKRLILVGSGSRRYRSYIVDAAVSMGIKITLLTDKVVRWEKDLCDNILFVNIRDAEAMQQRLYELMGAIKFDGIITYDEELVIPTAELAQRLGLRYIKPETAVAARNKYVMRSKLKENRIRVPEFVKISDVEDFKKAISIMNFPVVIKPIDGHSSIGVIKIETKEVAYRVFENVTHIKINGRSQNTFILEEYVKGKEISVESLVYENEILHFGITQKYTSSEPYFEEIGHSFPANISQSLRDEIISIVEKGIRALGINIGATHTELRLTSEGPVIIEIGARLGGDRIPYLVYLATGANMAQETIKVALGIKPSIDILYNRGAAIRFIIPYKCGEIVEYPNLDKASNYPGICEVSFKEQVGQIKLPPEGFFTRFGFVIAIADQANEAYQKACEAEKLIVINIQ
ncbi:MAG TPA: ATP-grasp domain-containing protein [Clostridia bacterium]|nr:ATP-grasp domain-containing protein [Clostridia bacterium]